MNPPAGFTSMDQVIAFVGAIVCLGISCIPNLADRNNLIRSRRIFWGANCAALAFVFLGMLPNWRYGLEAVLVFGLLLIFRAFTNTPYVKLRGKIYAVQRSNRLAETTPENSHPAHDPLPDSYTGSSTANQTWWMLIVGYLICMLVIYGDFVHHQMNIGAILATTICVYFPLFAGYWDASWNYPVARGHRLQLTILTIMTAGIFAALYFPGFYLGKRWPRRPKRSMEYRIHPRHWELDDGDLP